MSSTASRKTIVIDTSALIAAGKQPLFAYEGHEVIIPQIVLRELDKLRNDPERGYMARIALRALESLTTDDEGKTAHLLNEPVSTDDKGGTLQVELNHIDETDLPDSLKRRGRGNEDYDNDVRILAVAKNFKDTDKKDVILVSNDLSLRVSANSMGIAAEEFANVVPEHGGEFTGIEEHWVPKEIIDQLYKGDGVATVELSLDGDSYFGLNFGVILTSESSSALATVIEYDKFNSTATVKRVRNQEAWGMQPRSSEQRFALNHLLNPDIEIVSLGGRAGTGKTALALAAAVEQILEQKEGCHYEEIVVFRSPHAVGGQDLGYLPGDGDEKMAPWSAAVFDALKSFASEEAREKIGELIEVLPMTHIRGRSLNNSFVIIDEAQNLELSTLMAAISRIGNNSKVVLTWDITQRDNLRVGRHNGVVAAVNEMAGEEIFAHTTLTRTERSRVAALASRVLEKIQG